MYTIFHSNSFSTLGLKVTVSTRSTCTENRIFKGGAMKKYFIEFIKDTSKAIVKFSSIFRHLFYNSRKLKSVTLILF